MLLRKTEVAMSFSRRNGYVQGWLYGCGAGGQRFSLDSFCALDEQGIRMRVGRARQPSGMMMSALVSRVACLPRRRH